MVERRENNILTSTKGKNQLMKQLMITCMGEFKFNANKSSRFPKTMDMILMHISWIDFGDGLYA